MAGWKHGRRSRKYLEEQRAWRLEFRQIMAESKRLNRQGRQLLRELRRSQRAAIDKPRQLVMQLSDVLLKTEPSE
jgi:hypothetical protein